MTRNGHLPVRLVAVQNQVPAPPADWWRDRLAIVELLDDLIERGEIVSARDAMYVVEKPQKFGREFSRYLAEREWDGDAA